MATINRLKISPALMNSSCPWASEEKHLRELYACEYTGAVTTRTATLNGFTENHPALHTVSSVPLFFLKLFVNCYLGGFLIRVHIFSELIRLLPSSSQSVFNMGRVSPPKQRRDEANHHQHNFFLSFRAEEHGRSNPAAPSEARRHRRGYQ